MNGKPWWSEQHMLHPAGWGLGGRAGTLRTQGRELGARWGGGGRGVVWSLRTQCKEGECLELMTEATLCLHVPFAPSMTQA